MELAHVLDSDPDPRAASTLRAAAQVDAAAAVAGHVREGLGSPLGLGEAEHLDVVAHAAPHVLDAEDGLDVLDAHVRSLHGGA